MIHYNTDCCYNFIVESQFINGGFALELNLEMTQILFEKENIRISINDPTEFRTGVMQMMSAITKNRMCTLASYYY